MVGVVEEGLPAALDGQGLVGFFAMAVTRDQSIGAVELEKKIFAVVDVAGDGAVHVLFDAPAQAVVSVFGKRQIRQIDADEPVLGVVGVAGRLQGTLVRLGTEVAVGVVDVGALIVLAQAVGGVGHVARGNVRGNAVALGVVAVGLGRCRRAARGQAL